MLYHTNQTGECLKKEQLEMLNTTDLSNKKEIRKGPLYPPEGNKGHRKPKGEQLGLTEVGLAWQKETHWFLVQ